MQTLHQIYKRGEHITSCGKAPRVLRIVEQIINCQNLPMVVSTPRLIYPEMARIASHESKVFVRVLISKEGKPMKSEIVKRTPPDCTMFDKEATRIAMETKYTAGVQNGRKERVWMTFPVRFTRHES